MEKKFYLGIDGGGSKTAAAICDSTGLVLGRGVAGGTNLRNLKSDQAEANFHQAVKMARDDFEVKEQVELSSFEGVCFGLAGVDSPGQQESFFEIFKSQWWPQQGLEAKRLVFCNDGLIGLRSATAVNYGVCLVSSTGSAAYGIGKSGAEARAGHWGYFLGDQGSGFALGQKILRRVMGEYDHRMPQTGLEELVLVHLGFSSVFEIMDWVYSKKELPLEEVASLSRLMPKIELINNDFYQQLSQVLINELVLALRVVVDSLGLKGEEFPLVCIGGVMKSSQFLKTQLLSRIKTFAPKAEVIFPSSEPVEGALSLARLESPRRNFPSVSVHYSNLI